MSREDMKGNNYELVRQRVENEMIEIVDVSKKAAAGKSIPAAAIGGPFVTLGDLLRMEQPEVFTALERMAGDGVQEKAEQ